MFVFVMPSCLFLSGLVITCLDSADLLALLCVMFSCVFVIFPYNVLGQVWYLIVLNPDLCLFLYYDTYVLYTTSIKSCHEKLISHTVFKQREVTQKESSLMDLSCTCFSERDQTNSENQSLEKC